MSLNKTEKKIELSQKDKRFLQANLEIFIITYNRFERLKDLISKITNKNSPISECTITVFNNGATDPEYQNLAKHFAKFENITYISNKHKISAESCTPKVFESATKKYFWVLTDDDYSFSWENWEKIQSALNSNSYDIINVGRVSTIEDRVDADDMLKLTTTMKHLTCFPSGIYKTANISSEVMHNAYYLSVYLFPVLSLVCHVINKGGKIFQIENWESVVKYDTNYFVQSEKPVVEDDCYEEDILEERIQITCETAWAACSSLIHDKTLRTYCIQALDFENETNFAGTIRYKLVRNVNLGLWKNLTTIYNLSDEEQKDKFYIMLKDYIDGYKQYLANRKPEPEISFKPIVKNHIKKKILKYFRIKY